MGTLNDAILSYSDIPDFTCIWVCTCVYLVLYNFIKHAASCTYHPTQDTEQFHPKDPYCCPSISTPTSFLASPCCPFICGVVYFYQSTQGQWKEKKVSTAITPYKIGGETNQKKKHIHVQRLTGHIYSAIWNITFEYNYANINAQAYTYTQR